VVRRAVLEELEADGRVGERRRAILPTLWAAVDATEVTTMTTTARAWTWDQCMTWWETHRRDWLDAPFTPEERMLAQQLAAVHYFIMTLHELPGRCPEDSQALFSVDFGISLTQTKRRGG
jgi:hypothetical protein